MADPFEGVASDGTIRTGANRLRIPQRYQPCLSDALEILDGDGDGDGDAALYLYGSVATGQATSPASDVDLLTVGVPPARARLFTQVLSTRYSSLCRAVEIGAAHPRDLTEPGSEHYGLRVFLKHYCVHLGGADPAAALPPYRADAAAARGFNGDIRRHLDSWRGQSAAVPPGSETERELARRVGRKSLLAAAGIFSVRERTWSTDRYDAARRWAEQDPRWSQAIEDLATWSVQMPAHSVDLSAALGTEGVVERLAVMFEREIGLW